MRRDVLLRDRLSYGLRSQAPQSCERVRLHAPITSQSTLPLTTYIDDPSRITAADGLLASLDEHDSSRSPSSSGSSEMPPQPVRLPTRQGAHSPTRSGNQRVASMISDTLARRARQNQNLLAGRRPGQPSLTTIQEIENAKKASDLSKQITRRWKAGDVYAPHDLSAVEMEKWRARDAPKHDIFDVLDFKPLDNYRVRLPLMPPHRWLLFPLPIRHCEPALRLKHMLYSKLILFIRISPLCLNI